jgi:hypothetical protein
VDLFSDELNELCEELFPDSVKTMIATNVYAASKMSKNLRDSWVNMPMRMSWFAGHSFGFFIDQLMSKQIEESVIGKFPYSYRELRIPKCGYPYMEYYSDKGKFHIKKADKPERLPKAAIQRISNAQSNGFLDYGPDYIPQVEDNPFALITYGHRGFDLRFIEIGFPETDYSDWKGYWDISQNISKEIAESVLKDKEPELKEEYQEIVQKYSLKLK